MNRTNFNLPWLIFILAAILLSAASSTGAAQQQSPTPIPYYLPSKLILDEAIDFPLCWVGYISTGMRPCADTSAANQNIDIVWPTTVKIFEFEVQEDTWWALEVNRVIDDTYPGTLGVDIQFLDANGNWAGPLSYYVWYPTTGTITRNGVLEGQPIDPDWMNKIPYYDLWDPIGPNKYRILVYSEVKYFDGAVYGYWPSRGTIKVYEFDGSPPPIEPTAQIDVPTPTETSMPTPTLAPGDLSIMFIRVFQPIEGSELAAHRWTAVQVFPDFIAQTSNMQTQAKVDLYVNGSLFESRGPVTIKNQSEYTEKEIQRGDDSVIFFLPPHWVASGGTLEVRAVLDPDNALQEPDETNNSKTRREVVYDSYPIGLQVVILDPTITDAQANAWLDDAQRFLLDTYPIPNMDVSYPFARLVGKTQSGVAFLDAGDIDMLRRLAGTQFGVGLYTGWAYGDGNRGFNVPAFPYAPGVGVEWPFSLAHEIGHTYLGDVEEASNKLGIDGIPLPEGFRYQQSTRKLYYVHPPVLVNGKLESDWINFMGDPYAAGVNAWVNKETYNHILHDRESGVAARPGTTGQIPVSGDTFLARRTLLVREADVEQTLVLYGSIGEDGKVLLRPPVVLDGTPTQEPQQGSYTAELYATDGSLIAATTFTVNTIQPYGLDEPSLPNFYVELPYSPDASQLILSNGREEIYRLDRSPQPPQVTVDQPGNGQAVAGEVTASWSIADADGDSLTYNVFYSDNDGATWKPLALHWLDPNLALDGAYLPGSNAARLRVIASDGLNFTTADSPSFQVPKHAPTVKILPPDPEADPWKAGMPSVLAASAMDIEDGGLPESAYEWKSDKDGALGQGSILFAGLSAGKHTVSVTVTDLDGQQASASVTMDVQGEPPLTGLWSPMLLLYLVGCLAGLVGLAAMGRGLWLAVTPAESGLAALQKEGDAWIRRYQAGQVAPNAIPQILERLQARDRQGILWALDPFKGQWLRWDGQAWRLTLPPKLRGGGRLGCGLALIIAGLLVITAMAVTLWWFGT